MENAMKASIFLWLLGGVFLGSCPINTDTTSVPENTDQVKKTNPQLPTRN